MATDDFEMLDEANVFQRAAYMHESVVDTYMLGANYRHGGDGGDKRQRFLRYVNAIARKLIDLRIVSIKPVDIETILKTALHVKQVEYKNPLGFIIGYVLTKQSRLTAAIRDIDKREFDRLSSSSPHLFDEFEYKLKPSDMIRYANLWLSVK